MTVNEDTKSNKREWAFIGVAAVFSMLLGLGLASWLGGGGLGESSKYPGLGGDFTLQSSSGDVSLRDFRGKVVVLYFGYGSCPDVCPTSLAVIAAAIRQLGAEDQNRIQPIFISVDPQRDTPTILADYARAFYPGMLGLTGSKDQIDTVTAQYKAFYALVPKEGASSEYLVDHTSVTYVIDGNGALRGILSHGVTPELLATELKKALG